MLTKGISIETLSKTSIELFYFISTSIQDIGVWSKNSLFVYPLILSLMSALIFWISFSYIPNRNRKNKLRPVLELDVFQIYNNLFSLFDLIMKHNVNNPSSYQSEIRGDLLTRADIELGLQNKCLNESYLFDSDINQNLMVIGEKLYEHSKNIDILVTKVLNLSQYVSPEEIILLEQIRQEVQKYDYSEKNVQKNAISIIGTQKLYPMVPVLYYRKNNFYDLYQLYIKLQNIIFTEYSYFARNIYLFKIQFLYSSGQYSKCKTFITKHKKKFEKDLIFYKNYYALCEYKLGNKKQFYTLIEELYKNRPYNGSLVSSRSTLKHFLKDAKVMEILARYHSKDEINMLKETIKKENKIHENFTKTNKSLLEYFMEKDTRLKAL